MGNFLLWAPSIPEENRLIFHLSNAFISKPIKTYDEAIVNDSEEKDELTSNNPFATLKVKNAKGEQNSIFS
ncbi:MAG: hypothetical protein IPQ04_14355 [Saprospiraceae bacterium]|nr:hypothetical protein [Saprospiraceae bacterium]